MSVEKLQELTNKLEDLKKDAQSGNYSEDDIYDRFYDLRKEFEQSSLLFKCTWNEITYNDDFNDYEESSSYEESSC